MPNFVCEKGSKVILVIANIKCDELWTWNAKVQRINKLEADKKQKELRPQK